MMEANPVRPEGQPRKLLPFPADRIVRAHTPGDQVAVTHCGKTVVYDSPADLAQAFRDNDGTARQLLEHAELALGRASELEAAARRDRQQAQLELAAAVATHRRRKRLLRGVEFGILLGVIAAIVAIGLGL